MPYKIDRLAVTFLGLCLSLNIFAGNTTAMANCYDIERLNDYDDFGNPDTRPVLGTDLWNNKIVGYEKAMELRLREDGKIDVFYTKENVLYGTHSAHLMENTFLNFRSNPQWQGQNVYFDWGKSILQLRDESIADPWEDQEIPMIGEYWRGDGHLKLERLEGNKGFDFFEIKKGVDSEETLRLTDFSTMLRPYIDGEGNVRSYAGDGTYCDVEELEKIFQELKVREDFIVLSAPAKVMTSLEVKKQTEGRLIKSLQCPTTGDLTEKQCAYVLNVIYSGLLRVHAKDIANSTPEVSSLIEKDIKIGQRYDYEYFDEQTDTWTMPPELKDAIFISPQVNHYDIAEEILKALKGEQY